MMKRVTRWTYITTILVLFFIIASLATNKIREAAQYVYDQDVASEITDVYVSNEPFSDPVESIAPGAVYYLNMKSTRKRDCFAQVNWYLLKKVGDIDLVFYDMGESTVFVTVSDKKKVAETFTLPTYALPGRYTIVRVATYQCSSGGRSSAIISRADFEVVAAH